MEPINSQAQLGAAPAKSSDGYSDLNSEQFIKIIFTELANQDPLQPNDSNALLEQLSNIRSIQSDIDLGSKLETLVTQNQLASASNLIGKLVSGVDETNARVADFVVSVSRTQEGAVLNLVGGQRLHMNNVDEIVDAGFLLGDGDDE